LYLVCRKIDSYLLSLRVDYGQLALQQGVRETVLALFIHEEVGLVVGCTLHTSFTGSEDWCARLFQCCWHVFLLVAVVDDRKHRSMSSSNPSTISNASVRILESSSRVIPRPVKEKRLDPLVVALVVVVVVVVEEEVAALVMKEDGAMTGKEVDLLML